MPFCVLGEPDHECPICQAPRLPSAVYPQVESPAPLVPSRPLPRFPKPMPKAVEPAPVIALKPVLKPVARSTPPGPPPTILVDGVSKPGPVSSGLPIVVNPAVRGGGVKLDQSVVQEFWRSYTMLGVTDRSAEEAITAAIRSADQATI